MAFEKEFWPTGTYTDGTAVVASDVGYSSASGSVTWSTEWNFLGASASAQYVNTGTTVATLQHSPITPALTALYSTRAFRVEAFTGTFVSLYKLRDAASAIMVDLRYMANHTIQIRDSQAGTLLGTTAAITGGLTDRFRIEVDWTTTSLTVRLYQQYNESPATALTYGPYTVAHNAIDSITDGLSVTNNGQATVQYLYGRDSDATQRGLSRFTGAPAIGAGPDKTIAPFTQVTLTANEYSALAITARGWTRVSGPTVTLTGAGTSTVSFQAPDSSTPLVLRYSATNSAGTSTDDITLTFSAGRYRIVSAGGTGGMEIRPAGAVPATDPPPPPPDPPPGGGGTPIPTGTGILLSPSQIAALPTSGAGWTAITDRIASPFGGAYALGVRDDSNKDVLVHALAGARLNNTTYKNFVRDKITQMMGNGHNDSDVLSTLRNFVAYIIAADLINLPTFSPSVDSQFRTFIDAEMRYNYSGGGGGGSVISVADFKANNFGTHANCVRLAAGYYMGNSGWVKASRDVWYGWVTGDPAFVPSPRNWTSTNWQFDPSRPRGINQAGAMKDGHSFSGIIPEDQRRSGEYSPSIWPPAPTNYIHGATDGATLSFWIMGRQGEDCWNWADKAMLRQMEWKYLVGDRPYSHFRWQTSVINKAYGKTYADTDPAAAATNFGYAAWWAQ